MLLRVYRYTHCWNDDGQAVGRGLNKANCNPSIDDFLYCINLSLQVINILVSALQVRIT